MRVYSMEPCGDDWGAACDRCHIITDGFANGLLALMWLEDHGCTGTPPDTTSYLEWIKGEA
jgi:hypothetical protein